VTHDALAPAGPQAARIAAVFWTFTAVAVVVLVLVLVALAWALWSRRSTPGAVQAELPASAAGEPDPRRTVAAPDPERERRFAVGVGVALGVTVVALFALLFVSVVAGRHMARFGRAPAAHIRLIGHQWWWEVQYEDPQPYRMVITANEIHVPVGKPVHLKLTSRDVIHSFWVPSLHGKKDLIPGKETEITVQADRPGEYRGQCAEFCGLEHAKMALVVVAEDDAAYQAWLERQRRPARAPSDPLARRGEDVFLRGPCAMCHAVLGTTAAATVGPDLTHLASRRTIGAGLLPNVKGHLAGWIVNPASAKPGVSMPANALSPDDLQALVAYLESLE
jgi:cytochrome c oxidase subunit II